MWGEKPTFSIRPFIKQSSSFVRAGLDSTQDEDFLCGPHTAGHEARSLSMFLVEKELRPLFVAPLFVAALGHRGRRETLDPGTGSAIHVFRRRKVDEGIECGADSGTTKRWPTAARVASLFDYGSQLSDDPQIVDLIWVDPDGRKLSVAWH